MKTYLLEFFLEWEIFYKVRRENHIFISNNFFSEIRAI